MILMPLGIGTMDEIFEALNLFRSTWQVPKTERPMKGSLVGRASF